MDLPANVHQPAFGSCRSVGGATNWTNPLGRLIDAIDTAVTDLLAALDADHFDVDGRHRAKEPNA
ncbi:MAG: hypothetical protein KDB24_13080 [Microthrixaceae bacterium]|nr:hypothetical protein [Microthrixaceae bacterium]